MAEKKDGKEAKKSANTKKVLIDTLKSINIGDLKENEMLECRKLLTLLVGVPATRKPRKAKTEKAASVVTDNDLSM